MRFIDTTSTKARFLMIGYGLVLIFWMSLEDNDTLSVAVLGTGATIIYAGSAILQQLQDKTFSTLSWALVTIGIGTLLGALSPVTTAFLMFFKTSWHSHVYPDYPLPLMMAILERVPIWALAGTLVGLAIVSWSGIRVEKAPI